MRCDFVADNVAHLSLLTALFSAVPPLWGDTVIEHKLQELQILTRLG
jgi:hypothetical protein